jgi:hypothetical protein
MKGSSLLNNKKRYSVDSNIQQRKPISQQNYVSNPDTKAKAR